MRTRRSVLLGIGSNQDRHHHLTAGMADLVTLFGSVRTSPVYETEAVGFDGAPFYNFVAEVHSDLPLSALLRQLREVEFAHGRPLRARKFSDRTLDIDVLTWGDVSGRVDGIQLPRDDVFRYAHVLKPLVDLVPHRRCPGREETFAALYRRLILPPQALRRVALALPGQDPVWQQAGA